MLAARVWKDIRPVLNDRAVILALEGPLGAGKTTLTKALASEAGIKEIVNSPTFILNAEYRIPDTDLVFQHIDAWRVDNFEEIERLGLAEMIKSRHLIVIEWADKFKDKITMFNGQCSIIWVKIEYGKEKNERRITYENSRY